MYNKMAVEVVVRKLGNSMGVIFPKELVVEKHIKEREKVLVEVVKEADLSKIFGTLKRKVSGQEFKDLVRKGWK